MIPIILKSNNAEKSEQYIATYIADNQVASRELYSLRPLKSEITIDQIRSVKREVVIASRRRRLFVIYDMDTAGSEAQNAFLKTLEEKSQDNQFILVTRNLERLLPTIRSRGKITDLDTAHEQPAAASSDASAIVAALGSGPGYAVLADKHVTGITRDEALSLLDELAGIYHLRLRTETSLAPVLKRILKTRNLIQDNNLNPQLAVDSVLMYIRQSLNPRLPA